MITKGPHADLYATIEALDEDNCRCVVKLSLSQELATVSQYALKLVDKDEFNKYSRYLNKGEPIRTCTITFVRMACSFPAGTNRVG